MYLWQLYAVLHCLGGLSPSDSLEFLLQTAQSDMHKCWNIGMPIAPSILAETI